MRGYKADPWSADNMLRLMDQINRRAISILGAGVGVRRTCESASTMAFRDRFPFKTRSPDERRQHEIAETSVVAKSAPLRSGVKSHAFEDRRGHFRLAFKAMPVPGFPAEVRVGTASITQTPGPIWTQRTHVLQRPGWRPVYVKSMDQGMLEVGDGYHLTVCQLEVTIPRDLTHALNVWRDEALGAVSVVVSLLDERVAQEELAEDLLVFDEGGVEAVAVVDQVTKLRKFPSTTKVIRAHQSALRTLADLDLSADDPRLAAGRWYLRAAQAGPTADAIVFLWIALEALAKPRYGDKLTKEEKRRTDVAWVELAIRGAGLDPDEVQPDIGRLAGLRAAVVHGGVEEPPLMHEGFRMLEQLARLLLRHRLETGRYGWPLSPDANNLRSPLREIATVAHHFPKTEWRDAKPGL